MTDARHQAPHPRRHRRPREGRRPRACCARSAWATTTSPSRRSASRSCWNEITPCNLSLDRLAKAVKDGVHAAGGYPLEFGTISVSDGISMGHEGMHFSLVSPRGHRRLGRDGDDGRAARRLGAARRLRQVAARHADGRRAARPRRGLPLRRLDPARARSTASDVTIIDAFEAVGACARRADHPRGGRRDRARDLPRRGRLRRHVHRQHDGRASPRRSGMSLPGSRRAAGRRPPPRRLRPHAPARPWSSCCATASPPARS